MGKKMYSTQEIIELLKKTDPKRIVDFVVERVDKDDDLREALGRFLKTPPTKKTSGNGRSNSFEKSILKDMRIAFEDIEDGRAYAPYADRVLSSKIKKILNRIHSESPDLELRISLQVKLIDSFDIADNYPLVEIFCNFLDMVLQDFKKILDLTKDAEDQSGVRLYMCNALIEYLGQFETLSDEVEDLECLESFMFEQFEDEFTAVICAYMEDKIKTISARNDSWDRSSHIGRYVRGMLNILRKNGASEKELLHLAKRHWKNQSVRSWFISYYNESSQWDKMIKVLEESLVKDKKDLRVVDDYRLQLKELYHQTGETEKYRDLLLDIIRDSDNAQLELFRQIKSLYPPEQWPEAREEIYSSKRISTETLAKYFSEDQLYERLLKLIMQNGTDYFFFDRYAHTLPEEFSDRILAKYEQFFEKMAFIARTDSQYQQLMVRLKDAHKISGGKAMTERLTSEWLLAYVNRKEFCEAIKKFRSKYKSMD